MSSLVARRDLSVAFRDSRSWRGYSLLQGPAFFGWLRHGLKRGMSQPCKYSISCMGTTEVWGFRDLLASRAFEAGATLESSVEAFQPSGRCRFRSSLTGISSRMHCSSEFTLFGTAICRVDFSITWGLRTLQQTLAKLFLGMRPNLQRCKTCDKWAMLPTFCCERCLNMATTDA